MMPLLTRRRVLGTTALVGCAACITAIRPSEGGRPHDPYFLAISQALRHADIATPTMVLDLARLRANAQKVLTHVRGRMQLRLVNKSLPCLRLLDELSAAVGTQRQMVFSLPYLELITRERPRCDVLLGKPLPVAAAAHYLASRADSGFDPTQQLQWLVDTPERMHQYRDLARARRQTFRVNVEIDVGLHRGGVSDMETLRTMLRLIAEEPLLQWSGFMGYDAHTQKIPDVFGSRQRAHQHASETYQRFFDEVRRSPLKFAADSATLNTGGSPTFRLHDGSGAPNEVAVGSAFVKPSDFDTALLADLQAAVFIATPVLKVGAFVAPDGVELLGSLVSAWDANQRASHFIYGGQWLADPVSPSGLGASALMGTSSNQQLLLGSGRQDLKPDDFVFFRPRQSEAVLQQFGDIAVFENGRIIDRWPAFPAIA